MPMAKDYPEVSNPPDQDLLDLQFCVQRHVCVNGVCLKVIDGQQQCRFKDPKESSAKTYIRVERQKLEDNKLGPWKVEIVIKRDNDQRIVNHNVDQLQHWRANYDLSLFNDPVRVLAYVSKYTTKSE